MKWVVALLCWFAFPVAAQDRENANAPKDFAQGKGSGAVLRIGFGTDLEPISDFSFHAESDPAGNNPRGVVKITLADGTFYHAVATCFVVRGFPQTVGSETFRIRIANISADITRTNDSRAETFDGLRLILADSDREDLFPDRFGAVLEPDSLPQHACQVFGAGAGPFTGHLLIHDE